MRKWSWIGACAALLLVAASEARAQGKTFALVVDDRLEDVGLLSYLLPRFTLKHGVRPTVVAGAAGTLDPAGADVVIAPEAVAETLGGTLAPAFYVEGEGAETWSVSLLSDGDNAEHARTFVSWLTSEIGQRTVATFEADGAPRFIPGAIAVVVKEELIVTGDATIGEKLSLFHCGRCHVISDKNRMGGIGSAPSFPALRAIPGWSDKFMAFWSANPHPSFTQVEGLTEPFDPNFPPHIAPVELTMEDLDAIFAYAVTITPKDLGAEVEAR
jgi:hypothetical protein